MQRDSKSRNNNQTVRGRVFVSLLFACLFLVLQETGFSTPVLAASSTSNRDSIAVVIGNNKYDEAVNVDYAINDAEAIKDFLIQKLGFREGNVILLKNATGGKLATWFGDQNNPKGQLWDWVRPGTSNVFVFYSGHGAPDPRTKKSYIIPTDVNPERASRGFSLALLQRNLEVVKKKIGPNRNVILMMDACFSGESAGGAIQKTSAGAYVPIIPKASNAIIRLSASGARQVANWDQEAKHGLLTNLFLKGVTGEADKDGFGNNDGKVSWNEVASYLKSEVSYQARRRYGRDQTPSISTGKEVHWEITPGPIEPSAKPVVKKAPPPPPKKDMDKKSAFEIAKSIDTCSAYNAFIDQYPDGFLAEAARAACKKIRDKEKTRVAIAPRVTQPLGNMEPEVPAPARFRIYNGYDLFGGDFARSKKGMWLTQSECQSMCSSQSRCRAFTYNTKYGVCFLKDRVSGKLKPWKTAISGILSSARQPVAVDSGSIGNQTVSSSGACGSGFKTRTNTDYFGNDIGGYRGSFSSCRRRCRNTSRCRGFSWIKKRNVSKRCWLKRAMRNPSYKSNVLSCVKS